MAPANASNILRNSSVKCVLLQQPLRSPRRSVIWLALLLGLVGSLIYMTRAQDTNDAQKVAKDQSEGSAERPPARTEFTSSIGAHAMHLLRRTPRYDNCWYVLVHFRFHAPCPTL